jgi:hypothetical protein
MSCILIRYTCTYDKILVGDDPSQESDWTEPWSVRSLWHGGTYVQSLSSTAQS